MTRPSAHAVRRTAGDLSGQMSPHLSHAKDVMVGTVLPKARETMTDTVLPRARDAREVMVDTVIPKARETMTDTVLPKAKATGLGLAVRAGLKEAPKKRHPFRKAAILGVVALGAYAAWNAWRLPHESDDWTQPDAGTAAGAGAVRTDVPGEPSRNGVPSDVPAGGTSL